MERKYEKTNGYWVYAHITPNGMYYIGMSKQQPCERWKPSKYRTMSLAPYIEQYGWKNIKHKVLIDCLTKEQAEQWEDRIIQSLSMNLLCINKQRSGGYERDNKKAYDKQWYEEHKEERKAYKKQYNKQYRQDHKEQRKAYDKQRRSTPERKIYNRVYDYNQRHTPIETPMEAKQKYLQCGYIPNYIKSTDLI